MLTAGDIIHSFSSTNGRCDCFTGVQWLTPVHHGSKKAAIDMCSIGALMHDPSKGGILTPCTT